mmetsp:Transcript_6965/g.21992  ORF Transcript_6965/g.21992 Transcript_6965/m.21992 type:complete len:406 (+) Transcript_6965:2970-4187(+)
MVVLARDALDLGKVAHLGRRLDVLVVHDRVLRLHRDSAKVVKEALVALVRLEELDQLLGGELLRVLARDLHDDLQVCAQVGAHHVVQALEGHIRRKRAHVLEQPFGVEQVSARDAALDVGGLLKVLERALRQPRLLAEHGNPLLFKVREHVVREDRVGDARLAGHQVHLEKARLQRALLGLVVLERLEQEGRGLLQAVVLHEDVRHRVEVDLRARRVGRELLRHVARTLRVHPDHVLDHHGPVHRHVHLLRVRGDFVRLARLGEALDHLVVRLRLEVDGEAHLHVHRLDHVAELLRALELVLLQPLLQQLLLALLQHGLGELERLELVQLALLKQAAKVGEDRRGLALHRRRVLEALDGLRGAQRAGGRVGGDLGRAPVVTLREQLLKLVHDQVLGAGQVAARRE